MANALSRSKGAAGPETWRVLGFSGFPSGTRIPEASLFRQPVGDG